MTNPDTIKNAGIGPILIQIPELIGAALNLCLYFVGGSFAAGVSSAAAVLLLAVGAFVAVSYGSSTTHEAIQEQLAIKELMIFQDIDENLMLNYIFSSK